MPQVGAPLLRSDDPRLLTGRGRYVDDLVFPRLVHVAFVRSVHAHALIASLELDAARRAPGVVAVLTGEDTRRLCKPCRGVLLHYQGMKTGAMLPLAVERVRYVGEPVVAIAAETRAAAEDAAARVRVEWTPQPAVLSPEAAVAPGAPLIHAELGDNVIYDTRLAGGDAARALDGSHRVWRRRFTTGRHTGVPIEPRGLVADFEPATRSLTLWMSTQVPHMMQAVLADLFGVAEHRVRVIAPDVGGSFGIKIHVYQDDLAAVAVALTLGRPVKWVATRRESFLSDIHAREQVIEIEVAADDAGVVRGDAGSHHRRGGAVLGVSALQRRGGRPGPAPAARALSHPGLRGHAAGGRAAQGDHLAVPGGRPSHRRRGDREHAGPDRAGPGARSRRDPPAQPGAARADAVDVADGQRLRQRVVSRGPRAPAAGGRLRRRCGPSRRGSARRAVTSASAWRASSS